jgi:septal ring factor EnvC (AmiA/AmiB activator)
VTKTKEPRSIEEIEANYFAGQVEQLSEDAAHEFEFADKLLKKIISEDRQPSFSEMQFFKRKFDWSESEVTRQRRRLTNVMRLQAIAGKKKDREALEQERQTSSEILEREGPKLEKEIAKLTRQKEQLEKAVSNAMRRSGEVQEALEQLRKPELQRQDVFEVFNARKRHFGAGPQSRMNALAIEIRHRQICLNRPDDMDEQTWLDSIRMLAPKAVSRNTESTFARWELTEHWPAVEADMREEIESMKAEIATLESQRVAFDEEQKSVTDFYVEESK